MPQLVANCLGTVTREVHEVGSPCATLWDWARGTLRSKMFRYERVRRAGRQSDGVGSKPRSSASSMQQFEHPSHALCLMFWQQTLPEGLAQDLHLHGKQAQALKIVPLLSKAQTPYIQPDQPQADGAHL